MKVTFKFHKLWVIESLRESDTKTGERLFENIVAWTTVKYSNLKIVYKAPQSRREFLEQLNRILEDATNNNRMPMIHLECHGCPDGLVVANGELLKWEDMCQYLIKINLACNLNLTVIVAACNGHHLIKVSKELDRAPFLSVIGPNAEITTGEIEHDFNAFYKTFFDQFDGNAALKALNQGKPNSKQRYTFTPVQAIFERAFREYHKNHRSGKGLRQRKEDLLSKVMEDPSVVARGVNWARRKVKEGLAPINERKFFEKKKKKFFFIDHFPDNAERFKLTYSDVLSN